MDVQGRLRDALVGKYVDAYTDGFVHHEIPPGWDDWQSLASPRK